MHKTFWLHHYQEEVNPWYFHLEDRKSQRIDSIAALLHILIPSCLLLFEGETRDFLLGEEESIHGSIDTIRKCF